MSIVLFFLHYFPVPILSIFILGYYNYVIFVVERVADGSCGGTGTPWDNLLLFFV